jgi:hypothetical protein
VCSRHRLWRMTAASSSSRPPLTIGTIKHGATARWRRDTRPAACQGAAGSSWPALQILTMRMNLIGRNRRGYACAVSPAATFSFGDPTSGRPCP